MPEIQSAMLRTGDTITVKLTVESALPRTTIWPALVDPAQLSRWLGHTSIPLDQVGGQFELTYLNGSDHVAAGEVLLATEPDSLAWTWSFNGGPVTTVRFSLTERENGGTTFRLRHENVLPGDAAADAATWHAQLEFLSRWLLDKISLGAHLRERREELIPQYESEVAHALHSKVRAVDTGPNPIIDAGITPAATVRGSAWA